MTYFGHDRVEELPKPLPVSEDFGSFGTEWYAPSVFWYIGGTDPDTHSKAKQAGRVAQDIPTNHSPNFAPVIHPTLETGVEAIIIAARLVVVVAPIADEGRSQDGSGMVHRGAKSPP